LRSGRGRLVGDCCNSVTKITRRCFSGKTRPPASPRRWPSLGPPVCKNARPLFSEPRIGAPKISSSSEGLDARWHFICDQGHRSYDLSQCARRSLPLHRHWHFPGAGKITKRFQGPGAHLEPTLEPTLKPTLKPCIRFATSRRIQQCTRLRSGSPMTVRALGPATGLMGRRGGFSQSLICLQTARLSICQPRVTPRLL
jgi:hypothetical protein